MGLSYDASQSVAVRRTKILYLVVVNVVIWFFILSVTGGYAISTGKYEHFTTQARDAGAVFTYAWTEFWRV